MRNIATKLFDEVLSGLPSHDNVPLPDCSFDLKPDAQIEDKSYHNCDVISSDDYDLRRTAIDSLSGAKEDGLIEEEDKELIEGGLRHEGFETIAFYKSYRFKDNRPFPGLWGIFYIEQGLAFVENKIIDYYPSYGNPRALARGFLYSHEHIHYQNDIKTLMLESITKRHLYLPLHRAFNRYRSHFVEEAIANKNAFNWSKAKGIEEFASDFMDIQPNAYARYGELQQKLYGEWYSNVLECKPPYSEPIVHLAPWGELIPSTFKRSSVCPEHFIHTNQLSDLISPAYIPPHVRQISDSKSVQKIIQKKYRNLERTWEQTKQKLLTDRLLPGLNLKPWPKIGKNIYSVKVNDGFRAHITHLGNNVWEAIEFGNHKELGHG